MNVFGITPDPGVSASSSGWICDKCGIYVPESIGHHACPNSIYDGSNQPQVEIAYDAKHADIMQRLGDLDNKITQLVRSLDEVIGMLRGEL